MIAGQARSQLRNKNLVSRIPVGRLGKPEDVVEVIMMLVVNSYLINQTLLVDGGMYPH